MGFHSWQTRKVAENAASHLEPSETVRASVVCQTLGSGLNTESAVGEVLSGGDSMSAGASGGRGYAVVATDEHIYLIELRGLTALGDVAAKYRIDAVPVDLDKSLFRPDLKIGKASLTTMAFGGKKYAKRLVEVARERGAKPL